jgi:hypothetical protein
MKSFNASLYRIAVLFTWKMDGIPIIHTIYFDISIGKFLPLIRKNAHAN